MILKQILAKNNWCYKYFKVIQPKGIMVHSTGANNPNLKRYVQPDDGTIGVNSYGNHFNTEKPGGRKVCVHAFIGKLKDGTIATVQIMPWYWRAYHSGSGWKGAAYNKGYIGFEICEDGLSDKTYFNKVYKEAVELCAYLCEKYNIPTDKIICHSEGYKQGIASNHGDVMHWFPKHGKNMKTFREDVAKMLTSKNEPVAVEQATKPITTTSYLVKINTGTLNVRKGPGTSYGITTTVKRGGVYTIVQETNGWGKLKSGVGWIKLSYTKKV